MTAVERGSESQSGVVFAFGGLAGEAVTVIAVGKTRSGSGALRHLEWVIMMFTIAHVVLGGVFVLYGWWVLTVMAWLSAAAWLAIGCLTACALMENQEPRP